MRISPKEKQAIIRSFQEILPNTQYSLYLFGSRTDDTKRGGDIDLLVVTSPSSKQVVATLKTKIRFKIFDYIPEQKIDITVATPDEIKSDAFLAQVFPGAIELTK